MNVPCNNFLQNSFHHPIIIQNKLKLLYEIRERILFSIARNQPIDFIGYEEQAKGIFRIVESRDYLSGLSVKKSPGEWQNFIATSPNGFFKLASVVLDEGAWNENPRYLLYLNGEFQIDSDGYLVNRSGNYLLGYNLENYSKDDINFYSFQQLEKINISEFNIPQKNTTIIDASNIVVPLDVNDDITIISTANSVDSNIQAEVTDKNDEDNRSLYEIFNSDSNIVKKLDTQAIYHDENYDLLIEIYLAKKQESGKKKFLVEIVKNGEPDEDPKNDKTVIYRNYFNINEIPENIPLNINGISLINLDKIITDVNETSLDVIDNSLELFQDGHQEYTFNELKISISRDGVIYVEVKDNNEITLDKFLIALSSVDNSSYNLPNQHWVPENEKLSSLIFLENEQHYIANSDNYMSQLFLNDINNQISFWESFII